MDKQRWLRVRTLFDAAAELPEAERGEFLAAQCADDRDLIDEVVALLAADAVTHAPQSALNAVAPDLIENLAGEKYSDVAQRWIGKRLGVWEIRDMIGRGGMGAVFLAERADGAYRLQAALKLVRADISAAELHSRFVAERQILASLDHPRIARLLDGGSDQGTPYFVIEYVDGRPITEYCDAQRSSVAARLRLFLSVCDAVEHAHRRLVVHRDLKPSNILVDREGRAKLLDFGIAKLLDAGARAQETSTGMRLFTPEYAAPEQLRGETITTAVDVHALGVLLHELLTGRRPWGEAGATPQALERAILDHDAAPPSSLVTTRRSGAEQAERCAAQRGLDWRHLKRALAGDLDAIVLKALRKDPSERYASVAELRDDVERHLQRQPVRARRGSRRYRMQRFFARHALASGLAGVALLSLVAGLGLALWQARVAAVERDAARAEAAKSRAVLDFMGGLFELADPSEARGRKVTAEELLGRGTERIKDALSDQPAARAELLTSMGAAHAGLGLYEQALPVLEEAVALARGAGDAQALAEAELKLAATLHALGRYPDVVAALSPLLATLSETEREPVLLRAAIEGQLGSALQASGDHVGAERAYRSALAARQRLLGDADRKTQQSALRYVSLLTLIERYDEARALAERTSKQIEASSGTDDPMRAEGYSSLAMVLSHFGERDAVEKLRRQELEIFERAYGPDHPDTVSAQNDLASALFEKKQYAAAAPLYTTVLEARRAKFGADHPLVALAANNLAWCHLLLDDPAAAFKLAEDAYRIRLAAFGPNHVNTAMTLRVLGSSELDLGRVADAERHFRDAIAGYDAALGSDNRLVLGSISDLTRALIAGRVADPGCANARRGYVLGKGDQPGESNDQLYQRGLLGACLIRNGDPKEGLALLAAARLRLAEVAGAQDRAAKRLVALHAQLTAELANR